MPLSPSNEEGVRDHGSQTLAELFLRLDTAQMRRELEEFRIKYEAEFGETDLTKRYTSTLPSEQQEWLLANHSRRYWDGLPPFAQAFLREKMRHAHGNGKLDDMPANLLRLYLTGKMTVGSDDRSR